MSNNNELIALREYAAALERENSAKCIEQETLYRQLSSLNQELLNMEKYYHQNKQLRQEIFALRDIIAKQESQLAQAEQRQQERQDLVNQHSSQSEHLNECLQKIDELESNCECKAQEIQQLQEELKSTQQQNIKLQNARSEAESMLQHIEQENETYRARLQEQEMGNNLQELAANYEKIEEVVLQKEENIKEMEVYINELENQCQFLNQEYLKAENYIKELEQEIKSLHMRRENGIQSEDNLSFLTDSISKIDLIRQNNRMLEKITKFEVQNKFAGNSEQRYASYSETGKERSPNSPSKLQMRIQTLKMQNQNLLRTLAV